MHARTHGLSGSLVLLTDPELDDIRDARALRANGGVELVPLPLGSRQRLVDEVRHWRELSRCIPHHAPAPANAIIPCPACGRDYKLVRVVPTPFERRREDEDLDVVEYIHDDGTRCRKLEGPPPQSSLSD
jgi:hypothetical protein